MCGSLAQYYLQSKVPNFKVLMGLVFHLLTLRLIATCPRLEVHLWKGLAHPNSSIWDLRINIPPLKKYYTIDFFGQFHTNGLLS
jgi:hypothetical protein